MQAQVEQWIDFTTQEIDAPMLSWFLPIIGYMEYNKKVCPVQFADILFSKSTRSHIGRNVACCTQIISKLRRFRGSYWDPATGRASLWTMPDLFIQIEVACLDSLVRKCRRRRQLSRQ